MPDGSKSKTTLALTVDADLVVAANAKSLDLVELLEWAIRRNLGIPRPMTPEENDELRASIESVNQYIAKHGNWYDDLQDFEQPKRRRNRPGPRKL